jgi:hypothetical protein
MDEGRAKGINEAFALKPLLLAFHGGRHVDGNDEGDIELHFRDGGTACQNIASEQEERESTQEPIRHDHLHSRPQSVDRRQDCNLSTPQSDI